MTTNESTAGAVALVVGAGPVGLTMACELWRHGVPCRVVDQEAGPTPLSESRALGIHARTLEVFDAMGIIEPFLARGRKIVGANAYSEGRKFAHVGFEAPDTRYPFVLIHSQGETERRLVERLEALGGAVEWRTSLKGLSQDKAGVSATLIDGEGKEESGQFAWLVGCDGAHSAVRRALGLTFEGVAYEEHFLLADVRLDWPLPDDEVHLLLTSEGPVPAFPLPEKGRWRLVDASGVPRSDEPVAVVERFHALLRGHGFPNATISEPSWTASFRIHRREADRFRSGRCFVAGDAAHIHSPVGGQGMNTGIQDAFNLAWKLGLVHAGAAPDALLDSYSAERRPVADEVLRATDRLMRIVTLRGRWTRALRNRLAAFLTRFEAIQRRIFFLMSELGIGYPNSPIVAEDRSSPLDFGRGPRPGERAPDVPLSPTGDGPRHLLELLRNGRHVLLIFPDDRGEVTTQLEAVVAEWRERIATYPVVASGDGPNLLIDADGRLRERFGAKAPCLYLIRPDGCIGYRAQPLDAEKLRAYLGRIFVGLPR